LKQGAGKIIQLEQEQYLERLLPPRDPLLREMEQFAAERNVPISDPEVGRFLSILARSLGARRILEIGTAIGYGALLMARGAVDARVITIDVDVERLALASAYLEHAGVADRVELVHGEALAVIPHLEGAFDLVYIDAVKTDYRRYLDTTLPKLRVGGMIVIDNTLWGGEVANPKDEAGEASDKNADALRAFNPYLMIHPQLEAVILPLGDGVGLATKTRPLVTERGGPF
jgi:caffeoyl-CoA O-methyltransferase